MQITLLFVGKHKEALIETGVNEYKKRIHTFCKTEEIILKEAKNASNLKEQKKLESAIILSHLTKDDYVILLDETGKQPSSQLLAQHLEIWLQSGKKRIVFIVGGAYGVDSSVFERANFILAMSSLTFTHQMVRIFLAEQIYRAFTIINKMPYHH